LQLKYNYIYAGESRNAIKKFSVYVKLKTLIDHGFRTWEVVVIEQRKKKINLESAGHLDLERHFGFVLKS
jgi:hypothetical protein